MKRLLAFAVLVTMCFSAISQTGYALDYGAEWSGYTYTDRQEYSDVPTTHWAYDAISKVKAAGWFSGYPDGTFRPSASISREEAMTVLVKFLGLQLKETTVSSYYDVESTRWSSAYIEAGKLLFPVKQTYNGQQPFQPEMPIVREDVMYAMVIAKKYNDAAKFADQSVLNMFSDANSISESLKSWVATAVSVGLVSGHANGSIGAQDPLTRAEFASMLYRAQGIGEGSGGGLSSVPAVTGITLSLQLVTEMRVGDTVTITASAAMSDGTTTDYSENLAPYNSSNNNVIMTNRNQISAVNVGTAVIKFNNDPLLADKELVINVSAPAAAPESSAAAPSDNNIGGSSVVTAPENEHSEEDNGDAALASVKWSVDELNLNAGETARIKLIGVYTDGSERDITADYVIYSYDESIAEVDENGKVSAIAAGTTQIGYSAGGVASVGSARPLNVNVALEDNAEIVSMKWSVEKVDISVGESAAVKLIGVLSDGSEIDITDDCVPVSDDGSIAAFEDGNVKGISAGETNLWFDYMPNASVVLPRLLKIVVR